MKSYERERSVEESLSIALETIRYYGLEVSDKFFGLPDHPQTYQCQLLDLKRQVTFFGLGKGMGLQSKVSAYYEALEHFVLYDYCQRLGNDPARYRITEGIDESLARLPLPCATAKCLTTGHDYHYPIFMLDPRYSKRPSNIDKNFYSKLSWMVSDSGTASGTTFEEASIHAMNELIERHAYSKFLMDHFLVPTTLDIGDKTPFLIDNQSLPSEIKNVVTTIETDYADNLRIFNLPNELGVPSFFASFTRQPFPLQPRGCGTSLHAPYAMERAVLETLQPLQVSNEHLKANQKQVIENFYRFPELQRCAVADPSSILKRSKMMDANFFSENATCADLSVTQQYEVLKRKLITAKYEAYSVELARLSTGFHCVRYAVPRFENFYLVQAGKYILPGQQPYSPEIACS
ncbi:MAG: YcaO-like family protein [Cryobacterium sp.]|nr:YcaO-like family protein [Oligoflexia bacterium]